jgi:hydroxymethylpyrimidine/phosphomethylpyrimidine kinase
MIKTILTIAGSDSSAGAGIQADLKTIAAHGCYGTSVITTITAQNTQGVQGILEVPDFSIKAQFEAVVEDLDVAIIKVGMLSSKASIMIVSKLLESVDMKVVLDPIISTSDKTELLQKEAIELLKAQLFPKVFLLTPNIPEAELLTGMKIENVADMKAACREIKVENILLKGGHMEGNILVDVLYANGEFYEFKHRKIKTQNTHGTGCTLSSAIASNLAKEMDLPTACDEAINYVAKAIIESYPTGKGSGSLNHCFMVKKDA